MKHRLSAHRSVSQSAFRVIAEVFAGARRTRPIAGLCLTVLTVGVLCLEADAQTPEWVWMSGSSTAGSNGGQPGVYGTRGSAADGNVPGGRWGGNAWTDSSGNLWLFGGNGFDSTDTAGFLNDVWEFNTSRREWAWMGGSSTVPGTGEGQPGVYGTLGTPAAGNVPGGRQRASSWTDSSGNLWLFGGYGADPDGTLGYLNDLWEFNPSTREWTWMGGSGMAGQPGVYGTLGTPAAGNVPGGRAAATRWTDSSGNFWLFGGYVVYLPLGNGGYLDDLWEFNPSTREWTWMGGSGTVGQPGVYGTLGTPAAGNVPGCRNRARSWTDSSGNLWLFGGYGADSTGTFGYLNDLWEFNPSTREWAWMAGSSSIPAANGGQPGQPGVYGAVGTPAAGNVPGGRHGATGWTDSSGNLWLFGGGGFDSTGTFGFLNDLWEFNPSMKEWAWMGGSDTVPPSAGGDAGQPGVYGTLGVPAPGNFPGGRGSASSWTDSHGNFWLFGGIGTDSVGTDNVSLNDLWEYQIISITNAASFQPGPIAPGEIISIFGTNIGPATPASGTGFQPTASGTVPIALAGVTVTFNNVDAPLLFVGPNQINAVVPYEVFGQTTANVVVSLNGATSAAFTAGVVATSPAIFARSQNGNGEGAILNQDNSVNGVSNPAAKGSIIQIFGTGEGQLVPGVPTGCITGLTVLPKPVATPINVTIGGQPATPIEYFGEAPEEVCGVIQINATVPDNIGSGSQPVVLTIGTNTNSQQNITVAVQ